MDRSLVPSSSSGCCLYSGLCFPLHPPTPASPSTTEASASPSGSQSQSPSVSASGSASPSHSPGVDHPTCPNGQPGQLGRQAVVGTVFEGTGSRKLWAGCLAPALRKDCWADDGTHTDVSPISANVWNRQWLMRCAGRSGEAHHSGHACLPCHSFCLVAGVCSAMSPWWSLPSAARQCTKALQCRIRSPDASWGVVWLSPPVSTCHSDASCPLNGLQGPTHKFGCTNVSCQP